ILRELKGPEQAAVFSLLKGPQAVHAFEYLPRPIQKRILDQLPPEQTARLLNEMAPDDRTGLLGELPGSKFKHYLALMSDGQREIARSLLQFPERSVGRLMSPDFVAAREHWTIQELLDFIRIHGKDSE